MEQQGIHYFVLGEGVFDAIFDSGDAQEQVGGLNTAAGIAHSIDHCPVLALQIWL